MARESLLGLLFLVEILVYFSTTEAAVGFPAGLGGGTKVSTNTTAAIRGHATECAFGSAPSRTSNSLWSDDTTGIRNFLAVLVGTSSLEGETSIAAALAICGTAA